MLAFITGVAEPQLSDKPPTLQVSSLKMALRPSLSTTEQMQEAEDFLKNANSDVLCMHNVRTHTYVDSFVKAGRDLGGRLYPYSLALERNISAVGADPDIPACSTEAHTRFARCAQDSCGPEVNPDGHRKCVAEACAVDVVKSAGETCWSCLSWHEEAEGEAELMRVGMGAKRKMESSDVTERWGRDSCTQPGSGIQFASNPGLVLLSRYPLVNTQKGILPSFGIARGFLSAEVKAGEEQQSLSVTCLSLSPDRPGFFDSPYARPPGEFANYAEERTKQVKILQDLGHIHSHEHQSQQGTRHTPIPPHLLLGQLPDSPQAPITDAPEAGDPEDAILTGDTDSFRTSLKALGISSPIVSKNAWFGTCDFEEALDAQLYSEGKEWIPGVQVSIALGDRAAGGQALERNRLNGVSTATAANNNPEVRRSQGLIATKGSDEGQRKTQQSSRGPDRIRYETVSTETSNISKTNEAEHFLETLESDMGVNKSSPIAASGSQDEFSQKSLIKTTSMGSPADGRSRRQDRISKDTQNSMHPTGSGTDLKIGHTDKRRYVAFKLGMDTPPGTREHGRHAVYSSHLGGGSSIRQEEEIFEKTRIDVDTYAYLFGAPFLTIAILIFLAVNKPKKISTHCNHFSCGVCGVSREKEINLEDYF